MALSLPPFPDPIVYTPHYDSYEEGQIESARYDLIDAMYKEFLWDREKAVPKIFPYSVEANYVVQRYFKSYLEHRMVGPLKFDREPGRPHILKLMDIPESEWPNHPCVEGVDFLKSMEEKLVRLLGGEHTARQVIMNLRRDVEQSIISHSDSVQRLGGPDFTEVNEQARRALSQFAR